ncbi:MAG: endonuclease/exonuclease/phosphatase family protein [Prevotellaceae bacterium]|jgi:exonuclease III|nr:endonuclease/exonuclease/phosphatase family protein [Prevotellaceae bacterium]
MKPYRTLFYLLLFALVSGSCSTNRETELKVLQLNLWMQARNVPGAPEGVVDIVEQTDADLVLLCELSAGSEKPFTGWLVEELKKRGKIYFDDGQNAGVGILSKYTLENASLLFPTEERSRPVLKAQLSVNGRTATVYSSHLDHRYYAPYLPRGYSEITWSKIDAPVADAETILAANRVALRDEAVTGFIKDAETEIANGHIVIVGGDLNEPSHLDWQEDTRDLRDHRGTVVNWEVSILLQKAGYIDSYRQLYPDAVKYPGFTYPAGNVDANLKSLHFASEADERDRIDFIYYHPQPGVRLTDARIVGPAESVCYGKISPDTSQDVFVKPKGVWPSDHKGNLAVFRITN